MARSNNNLLRPAIQQSLDCDCHSGLKARMPLNAIFVVARKVLSFPLSVFRSFVPVGEFSPLRIKNLELDSDRTTINRLPRLNLAVEHNLVHVDCEVVGVLVTHIPSARKGVSVSVLYVIDGVNDND